MVPHILFQEMIQTKEISGWLGGPTTGKAELKYSYLVNGGLCLLTIIIRDTILVSQWSAGSWGIVFKVSDCIVLSVYNTCPMLATKNQEM